MTAASGPQALGVFVVANIAEETSHGDGGLEIRRGLRHFAPGAKVWIANPIGNASVVVVGRHRRNSLRYMRIVTERRFLTNFRVRTCYSTALLRALCDLERDEEIPYGAGFLWQREQEEERAREWNTPAMTARLDDQPRLTPFQVSDPPPLELRRSGVTYYLAHFNSHGARYSPEPPPVEPSPRTG
ncbi:hypothetical protein [Streptomyces sp. NPDC094032]|uniref:hypothetical protein n=1 Tax=Streptomyces sp. NPDC094032 TaxID=3155308 RepID=UPI0033208164